MSERGESNIGDPDTFGPSSSNPSDAENTQDHANRSDEGSGADVGSLAPAKGDRKNASQHIPMDEPEDLVRERDEALDQTSALLEAVRLLSRLAAMDPADACKRRRLGSRDKAGESAMDESDTMQPQKKHSFSKVKSRKRRKSHERKGGLELEQSTNAVKDTEVEDDTKGKDESTESLTSKSAEDVEVGAHRKGNYCTETRNSLMQEDTEGGIKHSEVADFDRLDPDDLPGADGDVGDAVVIESQIESLNHQWALEQTAVPGLLASIQRLQSNLATIQAESDSATAEMHALHRSLADSRNREERLERAVKKLYKQNKVLKERLAKKKRDRKSLVKNVKEAVSGMKMLKKKEEEIELEERQVANRLKVHESMLRMGSKSNLKVDEVDAEATVAAVSVTLENKDSLTSSFAEIEPLVANARRTRCHSFDNVEHDFESGSIGRGSALSSILDIDAYSVNSISESSASTTSVDDSGVATVRIEPSSSFPSPAPRDSDSKEDIGDCIIVRDTAGDDVPKWSSVRSKMGLGDSTNSSVTGSQIRPRSSLFSSTSSASSVAAAAAARDRAASADDVISWSSVRASFGVGSGGESTQKDKANSSSSSMGQRLMAQLRSPSTQFAGLSQKPSHVYRLKFPSGKKIGLQFQKIHIENEMTSSAGKGQGGDKQDTINHSGQELDGVSNVSPFREAAADLSADLKAIGVRIDSLLLGPAGSSYDSADSKQHGEPFSLESGGGAPGEAVADDDDVLPEIAFLVCGYHGFDDERNVRPTIGARLVLIDGESLERGHWTFRRLRAVIEARANCSVPGGTFTMSFRNEPLTAAQREVLKNAVIKTEEQYRFSADSASLNEKQSNMLSSGSEAITDMDKDCKPPLAPCPVPALMKTEEMPNFAEGKKEGSFLKKLTLKKKDSKDCTTAHKQPGSESDVQEKDADEEVGGASLPSTAVQAQNLPAEKESSLSTSVPEKDDTASSAEEFKSTMKAMSKKFKSFF